MLEKLESWAVRRVIKKAETDLASIPEYAPLNEADLAARYQMPVIKEYGEVLGKFGFSFLGVIHHSNLNKRIQRDVFQRIYLSQSGEIMSCLGLMTIAGQEVPYIELLSENVDGKIILCVIIKEITRKEAVDNLEHKYHRLSIKYHIDIEHELMEHTKCAMEISKNKGFLKFSSIDDGILISKRLFLAAAEIWASLSFIKKVRAAA